MCLLKNIDVLSLSRSFLRVCFFSFSCSSQSLYCLSVELCFLFGISCRNWASQVSHHIATTKGNGSNALKGRSRHFGSCLRAVVHSSCLSVLPLHYLSILRSDSIPLSFVCFTFSFLINWFDGSHTAGTEAPAGNRSTGRYNSDICMMLSVVSVLLFLMLRQFDEPMGRFGCCCVFTLRSSWREN